MSTWSRKYWRRTGLPWSDLPWQGGEGGQRKAGVGADDVPALGSTLTIAGSHLSLHWPLGGLL